MCQRLYRPGYSMPELITPPRRSSTSAATRSSSSGSKGEAVRMTRTPPRVISSVRWASTWPLRGFGPGRRPEQQKKRRPYPWRRFVLLRCKTSASQRAASRRRHHCWVGLVGWAARVTWISVADRHASRQLAPGAGTGRAEFGHPPGRGRRRDELGGAAQPPLVHALYLRGAAGQEALDQLPDRGVTEQAAVERGDEDHVGRPRAGGQGHRVGERDDGHPGQRPFVADLVEVAGAHLADRVDQRPPG